jgi:hypothetical protein
MTAPNPCRVVVTPASASDYGLRFQLSNPTTQEITLDTVEPFLQFRVRATAGGAEVPVVEPALDLPVQPKTITIPPSGSVELVTPIRLRFGAGPASQDRFVWSIARAPQGVQLAFTLTLPAPFDQPFVTTL